MMIKNSIFFKIFIKKMKISKIQVKKLQKNYQVLKETKKKIIKRRVKE